MLAWQIFFLSLLLIQLIYGIVFYRTFSFPPRISESSQPYTVIVASYDDEEALRQNLSSILSTIEPPSECIVVDDHSSDGSWEYLQSLAHPCLRISQNPYSASKKNAIRNGVELASHSRLVFTDADCAAQSFSWSRRAAATLEAADFGLLYAPYFRRSGFLNLCIQAETFFTALQYFSYARFLQPYMGVGRNLAVDAHIFQNEMPEAYQNLPYGDDDILVSAFAKKANTQICLDRSTFVYSEAKRTWKEWIDQKKRHLSTGKFYSYSQQLMLSLFPLSLLFSWLVVLFHPDTYSISLLLYRYLFFAIVYSVACYRLAQQRLLFLFYFWEWMWLFYLFLFSPYIIFKTKKKW